MIPAIRANSEIFSRAAAIFFKDQRLGDQLGALLAGAYALHSDGIINEETAQEWIGSQDWKGQSHLDSEPDEKRCLDRILQKKLSVSIDGKHVDRTVVKLVEIARRVSSSFGCTDPELGQDVAVANLGMLGIKVEGDKLLISSSHTGIADMLKDTPWSNQWWRLLKRVEGAESTNNAVIFETGCRTRATAIPLELIFPD